MLMTGILPINKPLGIRSTQCVEIVKHICGRDVKVGHGGTLDSTASGVLVLLLGQATRLSDFIVSMPKRYEVEVQFGSETSTDDASGEITIEKEWSGLSNAVIDEVSASFFGWQMQIPPQVSAVHVDGKRAHRLSRGGSTVDIKAKPVFFLRTTRNCDISEDGRVAFTVDCRKGTYIRSFARDIGRKLGSAAHVSKLHRKSAGIFTDERCHKFDEIAAMNAGNIKEILYPISSLCSSAASYNVAEKNYDLLKNGQSLPLYMLPRENFAIFSSSNNCVILSSDKIFSICALTRKAETFMAAPKVNVIASEGVSK
ncbi:MAG: tRNA pseudouridine(55) synthase TruB [Synergistaceae bacterium]|nr:tRNA pseudouridine(55) synthase TruB [Synergistaceae bacterium]